MDEPSVVSSPSLIFPTAFCCNCGETQCVAETQETRVTRFFAIYGTGATFHLSVPVCSRCRRSLRRRPAVFFSRLLALAVSVIAFMLLMWMLAPSLSPWFFERRFLIAALLGLAATVAFYWLRRPKPPQSSFYQPVRIKQVTMRFADVMSGRGNVDYMKLAFTNADYLNVFRNANREAIEAKHIAAVKA